MIKKLTVLVTTLSVMLLIVLQDINIVLGNYFKLKFSILKCCQGLTFKFLSFYSQACYFLGTELRDHGEAAADCAFNHDGRLAVFFNKDELNSLKKTMTSTQRAWIGQS